MQAKYLDSTVYMYIFIRNKTEVYLADQYNYSDCTFERIHLSGVV